MIWDIEACECCWGWRAANWIEEAAKQNYGMVVKFKPLANIVVHSPIYTQAMKQISTPAQCQ
jgi:hypothetical protein